MKKTVLALFVCLAIPCVAREHREKAIQLAMPSLGKLGPLEPNETSAPEREEDKRLPPPERIWATVEAN